MQRLSIIRGRFGLLASLILAMTISLPAAAGTITTVAGNGTAGFSGDGGLATNASLAFPSSVAVDAAGNVLIADVSNQRIRRVDAATGIITTVAGNGSFGFSGDGGFAIDASLNDPIGVAVDSAGNLFIADTFNQRIRRVDAATGIITTVAGNGTFGFNGDGGLATNAWMRDPVGVAVDSAGNLFITDQNNQRIRRLDAATGTMSTVAGNGTFGFSGDGGLATDASLSRPTAAALDSAGNLLIADQSNHRIRHVEGSGTVGGGDVGGGDVGGGDEDPYDPYVGKKPLPERANKWGELRGKDRAGKVYLMNESAKESR